MMEIRTDNFEGMPITSVISQFLQEQEWGDEIEVNEDRTFARCQSGFRINGQSYQFYIEASEPSERIFLYMYTPFNVPPERMRDMARILNRINMRWRLGRLGCHDDDDANAIQFMVSLDLEGSSLSAKQITTMMSAAVSIFTEYGTLLAAAALTTRSADELWNEHLEQERAARESSQRSDDADDVPSEL